MIWLDAIGRPRNSNAEESLECLKQVSRYVMLLEGLVVRCLLYNTGRAVTHSKATAIDNQVLVAHACLTLETIATSGHLCDVTVFF